MNASMNIECDFNLLTTFSYYNIQTHNIQTNHVKEKLTKKK
jgi:hypothetical protein